MSVEVLAVTMNQDDYSILDKMNISSDALIGNQCDKNCISHIIHRGKNVTFYSFAERGVGLNRNNILMRAKADICIFADDDMIFHDNYENVIESVFREIPDADVVCLNVDESPRIRSVTKSVKRVRWYNYGQYGAARIAIRRKSIVRNGIFFNLSFGGGAEFSSGEDSLFLFDCLKKGLHIYAVPVSVAQLVNSRESTWFKGYNDKFFYDKGVFYKTLNFPLSWIIGMVFCFKLRKKYKDSYSWIHAYKKVLEGMGIIKG